MEKLNDTDFRTSKSLIHVEIGKFQRLECWRRFAHQFCNNCFDWLVYFFNWSHSIDFLNVEVNVEHRLEWTYHPEIWIIQGLHLAIDFKLEICPLKRLITETGTLCSCVRVGIQINNNVWLEKTNLGLTRKFQWNILCSRVRNTGKRVPISNYGLSGQDVFAQLRVKNFTVFGKKTMNFFGIFVRWFGSLKELVDFWAGCWLTSI